MGHVRVSVLLYSRSRLLFKERDGSEDEADGDGDVDDGGGLEPGLTHKT
jgi:hypothetical protein